MIIKDSAIVQMYRLFPPPAVQRLILDVVPIIKPSHCLLGGLIAFDGIFVSLYKDHISFLNVA